MTTENLQTESTTQEQATDVTNKSEVVEVNLTPEDIKALQANYKSAVASRDKYKQKLREVEEASVGSEEFKTKFESLNTQYESTLNELNSLKEGIKTEKLTATLTTALVAAGANEKAVPTIMKLIDKAQINFNEEGNVEAQSVVTAIEALKTSDPFLFGEVDPKKAQNGQDFLDPGVKRAGDGGTENAYQKELRAAKSQKEIQAVMKKYGILK